MGAEQTLASRNSQENTTSNNALCINDSSSQGLSLQRKTSAVENNTGVMQRKAWTATKPLDWLSEKVASSPIAKMAYKYAKKNAVPFIENGGAARTIDKTKNVVKNVIDASSMSWPEKFAKKEFVEMGANSAQNFIKSHGKDYVDMVDVCDAPQGDDKICYSPEVNYKNGDSVGNKMSDLTQHGLWHKHIIFDTDDYYSGGSYHDDPQKGVHDDEVKTNIRNRISKLTSSVRGPSNIGFMADDYKFQFNGLKTSIVGSGRLFSEEVLHKNYTQRNLISDSPKQDLALMETIEEYVPGNGKGMKYKTYDLRFSNCQQWVDDVKNDAKLKYDKLKK